MQRLLLIFLAVLLTFTFARSCYTRSTPVIPISVARDESLKGVDLQGREKSVLAFSDNLVKEVFELRGFRVALFSLPANGLFDVLDLGGVDAILTTQPSLQGIKTRYDHSNPLIKTGLALVVPKNSEATSLDDLKGKRVGVLVTQKFTPPPGVYEEIAFGSYKNQSEGFDLLQSRFFDGILVDNFEARLLVNGIMKDSFKVVGKVLTEGGVYFVTKKNAKRDLVDEFNQGLSTLIESGRYDVLVERWRIYQ